MATKDEVVSAITHIENLLHTDNWRGALNNSDYQRLKAILEDQTSGETWVPDSLIGALRNQWPQYFDPKTGTELTPAPDPPPPLTAPPPAPGPPPPGPSGPTPPPGPGGDDMSGQAADAAKKLDAALAKNHSALNDADVQLTDAILAATAADEHSRGQLDALKQSVIDQVTRIGPEALQTRAGMEELATFLQNKTSDILNVVRNAHLDSQSQAKVMARLHPMRYIARPTRPWSAFECRSCRRGPEVRLHHDKGRQNPGRCAGCPGAGAAWRELTRLRCLCGGRWRYSGRVGVRAIARDIS